MMQLQMCERTGGGCTYTGDDMRRTHAGMNIDPTEFNAIVEALMRAMDARGLPMADAERPARALRTDARGHHRPLRPRRSRTASSPPVTSGCAGSVRRRSSSNGCASRQRPAFSMASRRT